MLLRSAEGMSRPSFATRCPHLAQKREPSSLLLIRLDLHRGQRGVGFFGVISGAMGDPH